jgi:hypothetical protein
MDNTLLREVHMEAKKRRNPSYQVEEEEEQMVPQQVVVGTNNMLCLDLTGEDLNQVQVQVQVQEEQEQEPPVRRTRVLLPEQDQAMLLRTEEEFGEVLRRHTSLDRLEKHRGDCKKNAITISDDMRCDCIEKCKDGYECYASKHVMCRKMLTQDRKCYLCGSRVL